MKTFSKRSLATLFFIFMVGLCLFTLQRNGEFQGDDDYLYLRSFHLVGGSLNHLIATLAEGDMLHLGEAVGNSIRTIMVEPRHAPLPALLNAAFYGGGLLLKMPFTYKLFQFPIALWGALSLTLLYVLYKKQKGYDRYLALIGTLIIACSPIMVSLNHGLATYFLALVPLTATLSLLSVHHLAHDSRFSLLAGIGLSQMVISDVLWFVHLPLIILAGLWSTPTPRLFIRRCLHPAVFLPVTGMSLAYLGLTWFFWVRGESSPLVLLFNNHLTDNNVWSPLATSPYDLISAASLLLGPFSIIIAVSSLCVLLKNPLRKPKNLIESYAILAGLTFFAIFYAYSSERYFTRCFYQIYVLLPLVFAAISLIKALRERCSCTLGLTCGVIVALLLSEILSTSIFVWGKPFYSAGYVRHEWTHGNRNVDRGNKALGYIIREACSSIWADDPYRAISIEVANYSTALAIYSGIGEQERGGWFSRYDGIPKKLSVKIKSSVNAPFSRVFDPAARPEVRIIVNQSSSEIIPMQNSKRRSSLQYKVMDGEQIVGLCLIELPEQSLSLLSTKGGQWQRTELERRYDRKYVHYNDTFP